MTLDDALRTITQLWPHIIAVLGVLVAVGTTAHIVLFKSDVRAAIGWAGLVWLAPFVGAILYWMLGINRIRRRAGLLRRGIALSSDFTQEIAAKQQEAAFLPATMPGRFAALATAVGTTSGQALMPGNTVEPLVDGDAAYPAMIAAIDAATVSVAMTSYIFDNDRAGAMFADALERAVKRGVTVRVLIDGVGARYSKPPITGVLTARGITIARFLPHIFPLANPYFNLRSHRKIMVVDGRTGFVGGMNVREGCLLLAMPPGAPSKEATQDIHARVTGPVVRQLMETIAFDWHFTTKEVLEGPAWFPDLEATGPVVARGVPDGPDEDFETLHDTILSALSVAHHSVQIVTPYFLPDEPLIDALRVASMRGVRVDLVLPEKNNLTVVAWAAMAGLWHVLKWGVRVYFSRPPFDHSKIMVVDETWCMLGSANWDPRSLRLNFEYNIECYDAALATKLTAIIQEKIATARLFTSAEWQRQHLLIRLRNGVARLGQPYL
jgi:cardiolipin synthase